MIQVRFSDSGLESSFTRWNKSLRSVICSGALGSLCIRGSIEQSEKTDCLEQCALCSLHWQRLAQAQGQASVSTGERGQGKEAYEERERHKEAKWIFTNQYILPVLLLKDCAFFCLMDLSIELKINGYFTKAKQLLKILIVICM